MKNVIFVFFFCSKQSGDCWELGGGVCSEFELESLIVSIKSLLYILFCSLLFVASCERASRSRAVVPRSQLGRSLRPAAGTTVHTC